jgi:hypothetical protein
VCSARIDVEIVVNSIIDDRDDLDGQFATNDDTDVLVRDRAKHHQTVILTLTITDELLRTVRSTPTAPTS